MTYAVLAPEHSLVPTLTTDDRRADVESFVERVGTTSEVDRLSSEGPLDKRGIFTGAYLRNPFNEQPVPLYLADYVLTGYGTGAIMAVPAEDQRDWDFAKAYDLPIVRTVQPPEDWDGEAYSGAGPHINSAWLDGLEKQEAIAKSIEWLEAHGIGEGKVNFRLRDWLVSRQRFWGCPIPDHLLLRARHGAGAGERSSSARARRRRVPSDRGVPSQTPRRISADDLSHLWWARDPRDRHDGHLRRLVVVLR